MRPAAPKITLAAVLLLTAGVPWLARAAASRPALHMPWKEAGLTERQAAAHLLSRFTYGPRPGDVDRVVALGLDRWFEQQLQGNLPDPQVAERLRPLPALAMSNEEIFHRYPTNGMILAEMRRDGLLPGKGGAAANAANTANAANPAADLDKKEIRQQVLAYAREKGYLPEKQLLGQVMTQKLVRAVYSENQLSEVMTDFWFNHFNVSLTNNRVRPYLLSYERDAIRPNVLGRFRDLLGATARHPAMLVYLDNAQSTAAMDAPTTMNDELERRRAFARRPGRPGRFAPNPAGKKKEHGLNENYARELMELHTLGVDGGYTQKDVIEVARAFTGWSVLPPGPARQQAENRLARVQRVGGLGFQEQGDFLFRADVHDAGAKVVLGHALPAGRGIEDGEEVLDIVAAHPATARHLATQIAARFVADQPPAALVDRLAAVYTKSQGDVRQVLRALVESPEFWSPAARGAKIKSPFELAASALRALDGDLRDPRETLQWISKIGQPLYAYQAPTGYPDRAESWVNTGSLLNRMNFGLQLASGRVRGVKVDLAALNHGREPESREQALHTYAGLLMPERDLTQALQVLKPMVTQPDLARKIDAATPVTPQTEDDEEEMIFGDRPRRQERPRPKFDEPTPVEQVVGVILGSPEFQRR